MSTILVVYESWTGATREVAETVAEVLRTQGSDVDVWRAPKVKDVVDYDAVVAGAGIHMGRLPRSLRRFVRRNRDALSQIPVAYFLLCGAVGADSEEERSKAEGYLEGLRSLAPAVEPVAAGVFGGAVLDEGEDFERLFPLMKISVRAAAQGMEDLRDWEAIRDWARRVHSELVGGGE